MNEADQQRITGAVMRKQRLEEAVRVMRDGGDISQVLDADEFSEVRQVANAAVENKLAAMAKTAKAAVEILTQQ